MSERAAGGVATGVLLIFLANLLGGLSYPAQKLALAGLPPGTIALARTVIGFVPLAILARRRGFRLAGWDRPARRSILAAGSLAYAAPILLGVVGVERSTAANASILILLEPATIVVAAWLVLGERIGRAKLAGVALGLLGALAIVLEGADPAEMVMGEHFAGNLILAVHGILWGFYTPLVKPLRPRCDSIGISAGTLAVAIPFLLPFAVLEWDEWSLGPAAWRALAWCVALGIFLSFLGTVFWVAALRHLSAASVAPFIFLQPFAGVLAGAIFLGERLSAAAIGGGVLIAAGVAVALRAPRAAA
ncbi:MAG: DMT family transporter [Planctomycetota bacterium]